MNHEKTRIYEKAIELVGVCAGIVDALPPEAEFLVDELRQASIAVSLRFVAGMNRQPEEDRLNAFDDAASSARRVSAIMDVAAFHGIPDQTRAQAKDLCDYICAMLHRFATASNQPSTRERAS